MTKELKEFNGIKVGDTVYVSDLYNTQGATFILDGDTFKKDPTRIGSAGVLAIYDWNSDLSKVSYIKDNIRNLVITGIRPEVEDIIPFV